MIDTSTLIQPVKQTRNLPVGQVQVVDVGLVVPQNQLGQASINGGFEVRR